MAINKVNVINRCRAAASRFLEVVSQTPGLITSMRRSRRHGSGNQHSHKQYIYLKTVQRDPTV